MMLNQGDDSAIPVPAVFMSVPEMAAVVTCTTLPGLKRARYAAVEVMLDKSHPGHQISAGLTIHFRPPVGTLLKSETTKDFHFVRMPPDTISVKIQCLRKRPWQQNDVSRKGLPCAAGFACTDYKVQGRKLARVPLELRGTRTLKVDGRRTCVVPHGDPYSLYVQLSRCRTLDGIMLLSKVREKGLVDNRGPEELTAGQARLWMPGEKKTVGEALGWHRAKAYIWIG